MKKNKFTFLLAASFLVVSALAGCNKSEEPSGDNNTPISSNTPVSSQNDISSNIPSSIPGGDSSIPSGGSSSDISSSSENNSSTTSSSSESGGGQEEKIDWTEAEKDIMSEHLYGLILPFVAKDVEVTYVSASNIVLLQGSVAMGDTVLGKYASKFSGWEGGDVSSEVGAPSGTVYSYQKAVTQNGTKRYVAVYFTGIEEHEHSATTMSKNGKFYLEAFDPYEYYEYPAQFISEWLAGVYNSTIVPPSFEADYYNLDSEGVLVGRSDANIEDAYKAKLVADDNFTVESSKNSDGYYVAHPSDLAYVLLFKYDESSKLLMLKVEEPKGWNADVINAFLTKYSLTSLVIPSIDNPNIGFRFIASEETAGSEGGLIFVSHISLEMAQAYINSLKTAGYILDNDQITASDTIWYTTALLITDDGTHSVVISYDQSDNDGRLTFTFGVAGVDKTRVKSWPGAAIAARLSATQDSVPVFTGDNLGFTHLTSNDANTVMIYLAEGTVDAAKTAYIGKLIENNYVAHATTGSIQQFRSQNNEILVSVMPVTSGGRSILVINAENFPRTEWPATNIADAITSKFGPSITDVIPTLNVDLAKSCYVNTNTDGDFEIYIEGLGSSLADYKKAFENSGWINATYCRYRDSTTQTGVLVSPNRQLIAYFNLDGNNISIMIYTYHADELKVVGLSDGDAETDDWDYHNSGISYIDATDPTEQAHGDYDTQLLFTFDVSAGEAFKISNGVEWYGYQDIPQADKPNEGDFTTDTDKNIVAVKDGKVRLYLKDLNGNKTIYVAYAPTLVPWPSNDITDVLEGWSLEDGLPALQNESITGIDFNVINPDSSFAITVYGGSGLLDDYKDSLEDALFEEDNATHKYVSASGKLIVNVHADSNDLVITVNLVKEPEPDGYPEDDLADWLASFHATDALPNIHLENVEYSTDTNIDGLNVLVYTPTGSNTVSAIAEQLADIFEDAANSFTENGTGYYFSEHGDFTIEISTTADDVRVTFIPSGYTSIYPSSKLAQYFRSITVAETLANFSLADATYAWYWPTEGDPYAGIEIYKEGYSSADFDNLLEGLISDLKQEGFVQRYFDDFGIDVLVSPNREYCLELFATADCVCINIFIFADLESPATLVGNYVLTPDTNNKSWIFNADAAFYAYVWGGIYGEYTWIEINYDEVEDCFYLDNIDDSATGLIIVRMDPNGKDEEGWQPDWSHAWNQTNDILIRNCNAEFSIYINP